MQPALAQYKTIGQESVRIEFLSGDKMISGGTAKFGLIGKYHFDSTWAIKSGAYYFLGSNFQDTRSQYTDPVTGEVKHKDGSYGSGHKGFSVPIFAEMLIKKTFVDVGLTVGIEYYYTFISSYYADTIYDGNSSKSIILHQSEFSVNNAAIQSTLNFYLPVNKGFGMQLSAGAGKFINPFHKKFPTRLPTGFASIGFAFLYTF